CSSSALLILGCCSGRSVTSTNQHSATARPPKPQRKNVERQPKSCMIQVMARGAEVPPSPIPSRVRLLPKPRRSLPIQVLTTRLEVGELAASPTPTRKRTTANDQATPNHFAKGSCGAIAVRAVNTDHQITVIVIIRRAPILSASQPPGIWKRA